jgi:hypothetical protein
MHAMMSTYTFFNLPLVHLGFELCLLEEILKLNNDASILFLLYEELL